MTTERHRQLRLFYFVTDAHPAWRVDLTELFSRELKNLGIRTDWSMRRHDAGLWVRTYAGEEEIFLPAALPGIPIATPIVRRLGELIGEFRIAFHLLFGKHYDIIQVRDDRYLAAALAMLVARIRTSKFVYWVSFPFPENDLEKARHRIGLSRLFLNLRGHSMAWWLYKIVLRNADHVFVQSERMKAEIAAYGVPANAMTPVPMGVPASLLRWSTHHTFPIRQNTIVYLGTLAQVRHLEVLLDAFALVIRQVPSAQLILVGQGDVLSEQLFLEERCKSLGIVGQVEFTGFLGKEEAWGHAASASVCVSPIANNRVLNVGSPTKLYEYMALGRPVVANDHPEQERVLKESNAGLCVKWGAKNFADAIVWLLKNRDEAEAMGKRGPDWIERFQCYDKIAIAVARQYRRLTEDAHTHLEKGE